MDSSFTINTAIVKYVLTVPNENGQLSTQYLFKTLRQIFF